MKTTPKHRPPSNEIQKLLPLTVAREKEIDGIGMGVLSDGTAYLTGTGLAKMCGVQESTIRNLANEWTAEQFRPRGKAIADLLAARGWSGDSLFIPIEVGGSKHHAYPEPVCTAILEYYAFEANPTNEVAKKNVRVLMGSSLKAFVYVQVGYDSNQSIPRAWTEFQDRVSLTYNKVPLGYFCVFKEMANLVVAMIQSGVPVGEKTVPDISVGKCWGKHWSDSKLSEKHGQRIKYEHNYPEYFAQAASNPQEPWAYPDAALGEFRRWLHVEYFEKNFPKYIAAQIQNRALPPSVGQLAIEAVKSTTPKGLSPGPEFKTMTEAELGGQNSN
jgi:hypothetical protein